MVVRRQLSALEATSANIITTKKTGGVAQHGPRAVGSTTTAVRRGAAPAPPSDAAMRKPSNVTALVVIAVLWAVTGALHMVEPYRFAFIEGEILLFRTTARHLANAAGRTANSLLIYGGYRRSCAVTAITAANCADVAARALVCLSAVCSYRRHAVPLHEILPAVCTRSF